MRTCCERAHLVTYRGLLGNLVCLRATDCCCRHAIFAMQRFPGDYQQHMEALHTMLVLGR